MGWCDPPCRCMRLPPLAGFGSPQNVIPSEAWSSLEVNPKGFNRVASAVTKSINARHISLKRPQHKANSRVHGSEPGTLLKFEAAFKATVLLFSPCRSGRTIVMHPGEGTMSPESIYLIPGTVVGAISFHPHSNPMR